MLMQGLWISTDRCAIQSRFRSLQLSTFFVLYLILGSGDRKSNSVAQGQPHRTASPLHSRHLAKLYLCYISMHDFDCFHFSTYQSWKTQTGANGWTDTGSFDQAVYIYIAPLENVQRTLFSITFRLETRLELWGVSLWVGAVIHAISGICEAEQNLHNNQLVLILYVAGQAREPLLSGNWASHLSQRSTQRNSWRTCANTILEAGKDR